MHKSVLQGSSASMIVDEAIHNSHSYTIVGQTISLYWSDSAPVFEGLHRPTVMFNVDVAALQILTRFSRASGDVVPEED